MKKKLPLGLQHFPHLIADECLYVDKTQLLYRLIEESRGHFLSRPRRFGKSLLISTLASLFQGKRELFATTWIASSSFSWLCHPVIWLDFSTLAGATIEELEDSLQRALQRAAEEMGCRLALGRTSMDTFMEFISQSAGDTGVVVLIDEYDHPLLRLQQKPDSLPAVRDWLSNFYGVIKAFNRYIRYAFVTGVSKFAKVSLFSGMNHLKDITLDPHYATLLGITEAELRSYYTNWLEAAAEERSSSVEEMIALLRHWYNGYCFSGAPGTTRVYNPVSLHLFFSEMRLANYWFSTATPTFAVNLIRTQNYPVAQLEKGVFIGSSLEELHEVTHPHLLPLLFQAGYLTIDGFDESKQLYQLSFPNEEVRRSFFDHLIKGFTEFDETQLSLHLPLLLQSLRAGDLGEFFEGLNLFFAEIPYALHLAKEAYYHSLIYLLLRALGLRVELEMATSLGRLDLALFVEERIYLFEFKCDSSAQSALAQIHAKGYANRYISSGKTLWLVGVNINRSLRRIEEWHDELFNL